MSITSSSLIHYTNSLAVLKSILKEGFRVKYCLEEIYTKGGSIHLAVPMVSFCNLPFSQVKNHMENYGNYGIGLRNSWGGLNPVLYISNGSQLGEHLWNSFKYYATTNNKPPKEFSREEFGLLDVLRYLKNTYGEINKSGIKKSYYQYIDEKEWRYTPLNTDAYPFIPAKIYHQDKDRYNNLISHLRLKFSPEDIAYIIVNNPVELEPMFHFFETDFPDLQFILASKLITAQQILRDF